MLITDMMRHDALLATQREACRLLHDIIGSLDVVPAPDGSVRFAFVGDIPFLDRLCVWGYASEDMEFTDEDAEDDARDLNKAKSEEPIEVVREELREVLADFRADAGELPTLSRVESEPVALAA